jgi:hypothetical protein
MCTESVPGFIVVIFAGIVVENPACVLRAAGLVDETADFVVLARSKSANPTVVTILLPEDRIDVALGIERRDKIIAVAC